MYSKIWYKAIDNALDKKDVELLNLLVEERNFTNDEIEGFSKKLSIQASEVRKRIEILKKKNIILKTNSSIINSIKIWNNYVYVFVKASLKPPVIGMDIEYPTGWSDMMKRIMKFQKQKKIDMLRVVHGLHGVGGWDLLFILTYNRTDALIELFEMLNKEGWITKAESFTPQEYKELYIFDPVSVPLAEEYDEGVVEKLKTFEKEKYE
ncbi:MAG: hypothetical protein WCX74_01780 [Candidatus Paceibacterota bacterium]